jgi:hypothetical protein
MLLAGALTMLPDVVQFFATPGRGYDFITPLFLLLYPVLASTIVMTTREPEAALRD